MRAWWGFLNRLQNYGLIPQKEKSGSLFYKKKNDFSGSKNDVGDEEKNDVVIGAFLVGKNEPNYEAAR
jgi:hypothetical protein